jgi:hypothetical protein
MTRRTITLVVSVALALGVMAGPAAARPAMPDALPDTQCLLAGVGTIGPEGLQAAGPTGAVGTVITGHLFSPGDWPWCQ